MNPFSRATEWLERASSMGLVSTRENYFLSFDRLIQKQFEVVFMLWMAGPTAPPVYRKRVLDSSATAAKREKQFVFLIGDCSDNFIFLILPSQRSYLLPSSMRKTKCSR